MAFKYSKGKTYQGDIYNEDDTQRNTYLDWSEDAIGLVAGGELVLAVSASVVSSSVNLSASAFYGDGSGLSGVTATASPAGSDGQIQFNDESSTGGAAQLYWHEGNNRLGIGTNNPSKPLDIEHADSAMIQVNATNHRSYAVGSDSYGFIVHDNTTGGTAGYRFVISDQAGYLGYVGIGDGVGIAASAHPKALLHLSSSDDQALLRVDTTGGATATTVLFATGSNRVGIGTATPDYTLDVAGTVGIDEYIYHNGDDDTYIQFEDDTITLAAGGRAFIKLEEASQDKMIINHGALDIDLKVGGENQANLIRTCAEFDKVGICYAPTSVEDHELTVVGNISASINISASSFYGDGSNLSGISSGGSPGGSNTQVQFNDSDSFAGESVFVWDKDDNMCGVGTSSPKVTLDVHHTGAADPTSLSNDTGGGEVVYFGTGSLTAGKLYYLNTDGGWAETDASVTGSGHNQLLGISLGSNPASNGMLTRGYFDMHTYYAGSFVKGGPAYISIEAAEVAGTAPTGSNEYLRIVGYGTDTANVLYFNPDSTYVELG